MAGATSSAGDEKPAMGTARAGSGANQEVSKRPRPKSRAAARSAPRTRASEAADAASAQRKKAARQAGQFAKAAELFRAGKFGLARRALEKAQIGPNATLSHRARVYRDICVRKIKSRKRVVLETVEDHYNYAVKLVNDRKLDEAQRVIRRGLALDSRAADLHYIKAVGKVLAGDRPAAFTALKTAMGLDPKIRIVASRDPDLRHIVSRHPFAALLRARDA